MDALSFIFYLWYATIPMSVIITGIIGVMVGVSIPWKILMLKIILGFNVIGAILIWPFPTLAFWFIPILFPSIGFGIGWYMRYSVTYKDKTL